jgi:hypothetical protein
MPQAREKPATKTGFDSRRFIFFIVFNTELNRSQN